MKYEIKDDFFYSSNCDLEQLRNNIYSFFNRKIGITASLNGSKINIKDRYYYIACFYSLNRAFTEGEIIIEKGVNKIFYRFSIKKPLFISAIVFIVLSIFFSLLQNNVQYFFIINFLGLLHIVTRFVFFKKLLKSKLLSIIIKTSK